MHEVISSSLTAPTRIKGKTLKNGVFSFFISYAESIRTAGKRINSIKAADFVDKTRIFS